MHFAGRIAFTYSMIDISMFKPPIRQRGYWTFLIGICLLIFPVASHATTIDTATASNWNIRIDGSSANATVGLFYKDLTHDINGNGEKDLMLCERKNDYNSRSNSGSCYIIYDSLLTALTGTGNTIDLSDSSQWNVRFDGGAAFDNLGYVGTSASDLDGNGQLDLILTAGFAEYTRSRSGSVYIINDSIFRSLTGTGNTLDLNSSTNYTIRYDGATSPCELGQSFVEGIDMNDNGMNDLLIGGGHCGLQGRSRSGALYIIYDELVRSYVGTGNIVDLAQDSTFNLVLYEATGSYFTILNSLITKDIDGNGKLDIVSGLSNGDKNSRTDSGSVVVVLDSILDNYTGTGNYVDLTSTDNFNIRYDGANEFDYFGNAITATDFDNNGHLDFVFGSGNTDYNSRADSGSLYVIFDSLISPLTGTGNTVDLADTTKWHMRYDGGTASEYIGSYSDDSMYDYDNNGEIDLVITASGAGYNSRAASGSVYIVYDTILDNYSGTGNTVDLSSTSTYSHRFDGAVADDYFGYFAYQDDIDGDSTYDMIVSSYWASPLGRTSAGSNYIFYNFPHTLTQTTSSRSGRSITITGSVSAVQSTTAVNGVQYKIDSNDPSSGWSECIAVDGDFNSTLEEFTCSTLNAPTSRGTHTIYIRALNDLTVYTPQSRYLTYSYTITSGSSSSSGGNPAPSMSKNAGGVLSSRMSGIASTIIPFSIVEQDAIPFDINLDSVTSEPLTPSLKLSQGDFWILGEIHEVWYKDYHNGASVLPSVQTKPSVFSLRYSDNDLIIAGQPSAFFNEGSLKMVHSLDQKAWRIIPSSIVDSSQNTVSVVEKIGGYYALISTAPRGSQQTKNAITTRVLGEKKGTARPRPVNISTTPQMNKQTSTPPTQTFRDRIMLLIRELIKKF